MNAIAPKRIRHFADRTIAEILTVGGKNTSLGRCTRNSPLRLFACAQNTD